MKITDLLVSQVHQKNYTSSGPKDDILAAFHTSASIDSSSLSPSPVRIGSYTLSSNPPRDHPRLSRLSPAPVNKYLAPTSVNGSSEYDDPFGIVNIHQGQPVAASYSWTADEDDVLGALGKPVPNQASIGTPRRHSSNAEERNGKPSNSDDIDDALIAELVDMGFSVDKSREALAHTGTGMNIQAAIGWLLNQAHQESSNKPRTENGSNQALSDRRGRELQRNRGSGAPFEVIPAWLRDEDGFRRENSSSSTSRENHVAQYAAEFGSTFLKSASSLWKNGQRKIQRVAIELQQEVDGSQPRWMRGASPQNEQDEKLPAQQQNARPPHQHGGNVTDEAMMLESGRSAPARRPKHSAHISIRPALDSGSSSRNRSSVTADESSGRLDSSLYRPPVQSVVRPVERVSRQGVEEQSAQAYISPARRKKLAGQPEPSLEIILPPEPHILSAGTMPQATFAKTTAPPLIASLTLPVRTTALPRQTPAIPSTVLSTSNSHRQQGTEAYRRGDYAEAQACYTRALLPLPDTHPCTIILRCNRALTNIKIGEPKAAIADADAVLATIGPYRGESEIVTIGGTEAEKPMKEFYAKALMRKAEALEQLENWSVAASVWREAIEANLGGRIAIQGKNRCERVSKAASQLPHTSMSVRAPRPPQLTKHPSGSTVGDLNGAGVESEAVRRLRAANAAAATASDEAFALTDSVDGRLAAWKTGKSENLRALLASLDTVLWPHSGWSKVGMGDLVIPSKVKVIYMKAIAKVHPDKVGFV